MRANPLLILLCLAAPIACGAEAPRAGGPRPAENAPVVSVPVGWRWAVLAVLPEARVLEHGDGGFAGERSTPSDLPSDGSIPDLIASWATESIPAGFEPAGPWLQDRLWLAWRDDLGPSHEEADVTDPWTYLPKIGGDDGPGRIAVTARVARRLGLPPLPLPDSAGPAAAPTAAGALDLVLRRVPVEDAAEALATDRAEVAWFDGAARARWPLIAGRRIDRVRLKAIGEGERTLALSTRAGNPAAAAAARRLREAREILENLGYDPAR